MHKRKATVEENLHSHDKCTAAGLLVATRKNHLSADFHDFVQERVNATQEKR
jgi:hypothetical protein